MARRYQIEQPVSRDPASQHMHSTLQRALDRAGTDFDAFEASNSAELTALEARAAAYTPAVAGDWASPAPTTIADAIDRIAARMAALHGAIP